MSDTRQEALIKTRVFSTIRGSGWPGLKSHEPMDASNIAACVLAHPLPRMVLNSNLTSLRQFLAVGFGADVSPNANT